MKVHNSKIMDFLKEARIVTSSEVAKKFKISWNTADKYLLELALQDRVERIKKEGVTLWLKK